MKINPKSPVNLPTDIRSGLSKLKFTKYLEGKEYVQKVGSIKSDSDRFRKSHTSANLKITAEEVMELTRH